jgi:1-acyl-sn-glycerol-3-phosphate acyltransferase
MSNQRVSPTYRAVMAAMSPIIRRWGRLEVVGEQELHESGPMLVVSNHDSRWDPVVVGTAGVERRQIRALAKSSLWKNPILGKILDGMGQIPLERGHGDVKALDNAVRELEAGACIGVFPEGTISRGLPLRARSGAGRLAQEVPGTRIVSVAVTGAVDIVRFPTRPRIRVEFFVPAGGPLQPGESAAELVTRVLAEIRDRAPVALPGRRKKAAKYRRAAHAASGAEGRPLRPS